VAETVVAIPTFRRPVGLLQLLTALGQVEQPLTIIVADNDAKGQDGMAVVRRLIAEGGFRHTLTAFVIADRGISQVRNALVAKALAMPRVQYLAMIDDDEVPEPGWIEGLLDARARFQADVVGGPVIRRFEREVPKFLAIANNNNLDRHPTGLVDLVDATSNVLFDLEVFRSNPAPWFDNAFALTGGEDKDLMMGLKLRGRKFAWANDARVQEVMPASRCTRGWAITRAFRTGNSDMLINIKHRPPGFNVVSETLKILGAAAVAAVNLSVFLWHPARRFEGQRLGARVAGKLAAVAGYRNREYEVVHGH